MNKEQQPTTITLDNEQAEYLRTVLREAAAEGKRLEDEILEDDPEDWGGEFPDSMVDAAYERSAIAESILSQLS